MPHCCRILLCRTLGNTSKSLLEDPSPRGCGRFTPVTSPSKPMGDEVPAPGTPRVEEVARADSSGTCIHSPFAAIQLFQALSPGSTRQASPVTELGQRVASEAARALLAAPGHEPGNRVATRYRAMVNNGANRAGLLGWDANELCDNDLCNFPVPGFVYCEKVIAIVLPHRGIKVN